MTKDEFVTRFTVAYLAQAAYDNRDQTFGFAGVPYDQTPARLTAGICRRAKDAAEQAWDVYTAEATWN